MSRREIECSDRATTVGSTIAVDYSVRATIGGMGSIPAFGAALRSAILRWRPSQRSAPRPSPILSPPPASFYNQGQYDQALDAAKQAAATPGVRLVRAADHGARPPRAVPQGRRCRRARRRARRICARWIRGRWIRASGSSCRSGWASCCISRSASGRPRSCWSRWSTRRRRWRLTRTTARSTGGPPRSIARRSRCRPATARRSIRGSSSGWSRSCGATRRRRPPPTGSPPSARAAGDLDRAWAAASAGWIRAALGRDRGVALRADLDKLVTQAIIPDRAAKAAVRDRRQAAASLAADWEAFKKIW